MVWGLLAEVARLFPSIAAFLVLPRVLGSRDYGDIASLFALVTLGASLSGVGAHVIFMRDREKAPDDEGLALGRAVATTELGGLMGVLLVVIIARLIIPGVGLWPTIAVAMAEMLLGNLLLVLTGRSVVHHDQRGLAAVVATFSACRLMGTLGFFTLSNTVEPLDVLAAFYLTAAVAAAGLGWWVSAARGYPPLQWTLPTATALRAGAVIALTASVFYLQSTLDVPLLNLLDSNEAAGNYAVASRVITLTIVPLNAVLMIAMPSLVSTQSRSVLSSQSTARRHSRIALAYGVMLVPLLALSGPMLSAVTGATFSSVPQMVLVLSLVPILRGAQVFPAAWMVVNGAESRRFRIQLISGLIALVLYVALVPAFSWHGAVIGTYVSEVTLTLLIWRTFGRYRNPSREPACSELAST